MKESVSTICVCVCEVPCLIGTHPLTAGPTNVHVSLLSGPVGFLCCLIQECTHVFFLASLFWQAKVLSVRGTHCRSQHVNVTLTAMLQQLRRPLNLHTDTVKKDSCQAGGEGVHSFL